MRAANRGVLSFVLAGGLLLLLHTPPTGALIGAAMAMMTSVTVADPHPNAQAVTMALGLGAAMATMTIAALIAPSPVVAGVVLCAIVFAAVAVRSRGSRGMAVGMLAFMGYFYALFVGASRAQLGMLIGAIAVGGAAAFVIRFVVVRERAAHVRERALHAFVARIRLLIDDLVELLETGRVKPRRWRVIGRETGRVNEAALALEEAGGRTPADAPDEGARPWLSQILRAEIGVDMLTELVLRARSEDAPRRHAFAESLRALQRWIRTHAETDRRDASRFAPSFQPAVALITSARPWDAFPSSLRSDARLSTMSFRPGGGGTAGMTGAPSLRLATQATIAVGLAMIAGRAISPQRWYWAVLAAFVVFIRATTVAETVSRAWQRLLGTGLGVLVGTAIAVLLARHSTVATASALVAVFLAYAFFRISYGAMVLFVTIALALLYEMTGRPVPGLMELRVAETAAGVIIGVVVATLVLPMHSRERVQRLVADVVRRAGEVFAALSMQQREPSEIHDRIRETDLALAELRNAMRPLWSPQVPWEPARLARQTRSAALLACATRRLFATSVSGALETDVLRDSARALAESCRTVAAAMDETPARQPVALQPLPSIPRHPSPGIDDPTVICGEVDVIVRRLVVQAGLGAL